MDEQSNIYWRLDVGDGAEYTLEKLAMEYREHRVNGDVILRRGGVSGPEMTFREVLRSERDLQLLIGEEDLPVTLDDKRGLWEEFRYRIALFLQVVRDGDFSKVEFVRRLERLTAEKQEVLDRAELAERVCEEERKNNSLLQRELGVACCALRDVVASHEFSLVGSESARKELAKNLQETLQRILAAIGEENSSVASIGDSVSRLMLLYEVERSSKERAEAAQEAAAKAIAAQERNYTLLKEDISRYCLERERLLNLKKGNAKSALESMRHECEHIASTVGWLRNSVVRGVSECITPAWSRVWVRGDGKGIPEWRLLYAVKAFGPSIAPWDVVAIADGTVTGCGRYGIVLTVFGIHVKDASHHEVFPWGDDIAVEVGTRGMFEVGLRIKDQRFAFKVASPWVLKRFLAQLSHALEWISLPPRIRKIVDSVHDFKLALPSEDEIGKRIEGDGA